MKLVFGLQADGRAYPDFPGGAIGVLGEAVVGPRGLLDILETQLGLTGPSKAEAIRIAAYSTKLANALTRRPSAFFARSFEKDSWSTAERLLRWRDDLILAGWNGAPIGVGRIDGVNLKDVLGDIQSDRNTHMHAQSSLAGAGSPAYGTPKAGCVPFPPIKSDTSVTKETEPDAGPRTGCL